MITNKINELRVKRKNTEKEIAESIGMSVTGYRQALEKNDFKLSTLYKISEFLQVPITYWFEPEEKNNVYLDNQGSIINQSDVRGNVSVGSQSIQDMQHKIELLTQEIDGLKEQLATKNELIEVLKNLK